MSLPSSPVVRSVAFAVVVAVLLPPVVGAQEESRWFFKLDSFLPMNQTTRVRYDAPIVGQGVQFDLEGEPGLDDSYSQVRAALGGRIGERRRHEIEVSILDVSRDNTRTLTQGLALGDVIVPVGVDLTTTAETTDFELSYKYYFVQRDSGELGVIVGLHVLNFDSRLTALITPIPGLPFSIPITVTAEVTAPIPLIGLQGNVEIAPKWHFNASIKVMDGSYDDIEGSFVELQAAVEHYTFAHLGFGLGFFSDEIDGRETSGDAIILGDWNQKRDGALLFLRARW